MDLKKDLKSLRDSQAEMLRHYEGLLREVESTDLYNENEQLKKELKECRKELVDLQERYHRASRENQELRTALQEQITDEKMNILKISRRKLEAYFQSQSEAYHNGLTALEEKIKSRIAELHERARRLLLAEREMTLQTIATISESLHQKINLQRDQYETAKNSVSQDAQNAYERLAAEPVTQEMVQKRVKQNQLEMKLGLDWVNKIGIGLILLGVIFAFQYTYTHWFTNHLKGICFFLLGGLFLVGGELLYQKKRETFAQGVIGGGVAILYSSIFYSFFLLKIIGLNIGLFLSVLVTVTTIVLSLRYSSRTICSLGLGGGFLPFFAYVYAFGLQGNGFYLAMGYLLVLNLFLLLISFRRNWPVVNDLSFLLNIPSLIYLVLNAPEPRWGLIYTVLTFLMYLVVALAYPVKYHKAPNIILLALNTITSCSVLYALFEKAGFQELRGLLALVLSLIYAGFGQFVTKVLKEETKTQILFYLTSLTFAVLMIPFQFGVQWFLLGWLVEGILLVIYGYKKKILGMEIAGWVVFGLCLVVFYGQFFLEAVNLTEILFFDYKYLAIMAGLILTAVIYLRDIQGNTLPRYSIKGALITKFKYFTLVNFWFYLIYTFTKFYPLLNVEDQFFGFYKYLGISVISITFGLVVTKVPMLEDRYLKYFAYGLLGLGDLICLYLTIVRPLLGPASTSHPALGYLALGLLIAYNILIFFNIKEIIMAFLNQTKSNLEIFPLMIGIYLLGIITAFLIVQFRMGRVNLVFSFVWLVLAIAYIIYGFRKKFVYIRRLGLGLTLFSTAKLFIYDLSFLDQIGKIIAYFGFGLTLLLISYIYQKVKNSMEDSDVFKSM